MKQDSVLQMLLTWAVDQRVSQPCLAGLFKHVFTGTTFIW